MYFDNIKNEFLYYVAGLAARFFRIFRYKLQITVYAIKSITGGIKCPGCHGS
jgi:hypothetical protein